MTFGELQVGDLFRHNGLTWTKESALGDGGKPCKYCRNEGHALAAGRKYSLPIPLDAPVRRLRKGKYVREEK